MARKPRVNLAGFHHIINRGMARDNVYKCDDDKERYLDILCKASKIYKVIVHDYCLMDNHYNLLIETTSENLSLFMRQINSNYAIYFNKKYKRIGHLWQGRYKSWYIINEQYLYDLFSYIEHNPIEAKITKKIGEYPFTLLATLLDKNKEVISCAKYSKLIKEIEYDGMQEHLNMALSKDELEILEIEKSKKIIQKEYKIRQERSISLQEYFNNIITKDDRNKAILKALDDGYRQSEIAKYLNISCATVSKIFRSVK